MAGSRPLVHVSIHDDPVQRLIALAKDARIGEPSRIQTQIGPIATRPQFQKVVAMIEAAMAEGAICVLGGHALTGEQNGQRQFVAPTICTGVHSRMSIAQNEVVGQMLSVIPFTDKADAIQIGNDIDFGLAAAGWTRDLRLAIHCVDRFNAGTVWVNDYCTIGFATPFGGFKASRLGRDGGVDAYKEDLRARP